MKISRHTEYTAPVRSKDPMHVQIGFRRFLAAPIFSEIDPHVTDRGQLKRFLPIDDKPTYYMATMYSRITFPPATVLMFAAHVLGSSKNDFPFNPLVASGQLIGPNPNKLILKRSVLTGYPKSVEQHHAVIRHMFYNASDVNFFKTVELWTKFKTKGRIEKSRGLKGIFDASFEKTLTQKSPVHISLYKRQFPVWNPTYL
jgi:pre-rRNA-processing protein TSR1